MNDKPTAKQYNDTLESMNYWWKRCMSAEKIVEDLEKDKKPVELVRNDAIDHLYMYKSKGKKTVARDAGEMLGDVLREQASRRLGA